MKILNPTKRPTETIACALEFDQAFTLLEDSLGCRPGIYALVDTGPDGTVFVQNRFGTFQIRQDARVEIYV